MEWTFLQQQAKAAPMAPVVRLGSIVEKNLAAPASTGAVLVQWSCLSLPVGRVGGDAGSPSCRGWKSAEWWPASQQFRTASVAPKAATPCRLSVRVVLASAKCSLHLQRC